MSSKRVVVRFQHPAPALHDVGDRDRVAVFNPEACAERGEWIQIDAEHAVDGREAL